MPTDVIMPQMGESIFEGTITKWLKKPGDAVEKDEPLFEISTDKVDAEIPSPAAGVLGEIKFAEGATVQINAVVAVLNEAGSNAKASNGPAVQSSAKPPVPKEQETKPAAAQPATAPKDGGTEVVMPQMGESIFEGTITKWLKKLGDGVAKDEPLFEISTDKVDAEIPSPLDGVLTEIKVAEGATVQINTVVAVIGGSGPSPAKSSAVPEKQTAAAAPASAPVAAPSNVEVSASGKGIRSSPLVRKMAKEHNIDLSQIRGTGSAGRISKEDILRHLSQPAETRSGATPLQVPVQAMTGDLVPMSRMRVLIAQRMTESMRTIPHAHNVYKVDMTRIVRLRDRERAGFEQRNGVKLTYMPFIAAAAMDALRKFPILNASLVESNIQYHANIQLGIAVALEWGLIVPVIRQAEQESFAALANAINDLGSRARSKKLRPDEVGGSTFTLTNAGVFGGEFGLPVINPPESAILAIGGLRKEPVVLSDSDGNDTIAIRSVQYFCLGFDHRLIDGADAGKFMTEFKNTLENWNQPIG
ncbi:MAG TPA: 2-oxoglutarate dehydrogenase, E2 component, dihydrolipoamide succinyltransferase [Terracidiphilus sp.]|jgi:pyruvate dehydrogenase E2 component (dihydrolipoamide acetyltransferase)|nr:2-oxoglutarate dehydrogenase, E2 component, dihydrolipoamide succinyltransferase [Terracidiphilus sp.]